MNWYDAVEIYPKDGMVCVTFLGLGGVSETVQFTPGQAHLIAEVLER